MIIVTLIHHNISHNVSILPWLNRFGPEEYAQDGFHGDPRRAERSPGTAPLYGPGSPAWHPVKEEPAPLDGNPAERRKRQLPVRDRDVLRQASRQSPCLCVVMACSHMVCPLYCSSPGWRPFRYGTQWEKEEGQV